MTETVTVLEVKFVMRSASRTMMTRNTKGLMLENSFTPAYVARGAVTSPAEINKLKGYIKNAFEAQLNHEGYSLVEVMCSCPTNWGMDAIAAKKRLVDEVIPYYQLGEIKKRGE